MSSSTLQIIRPELLNSSRDLSRAILDMYEHPSSKTEITRLFSPPVTFQMAQDRLQRARQVCDPLPGLSEGGDRGSTARGQR